MERGVPRRHWIKVIGSCKCPSLTSLPPPTSNANPSLFRSSYSFPVEHEIPPAVPAFSLHQLSFRPPIQTGLPLEIHKLNDIYLEGDSKRCTCRNTPICLRFLGYKNPE
ncbi:hypothetical protein QQF64_027952 [Cirrhinus molitorella]|uniref:Uncharacterized protein n=1 Tax=Cirrhinus molitorella TaxID=172907 RepID=A0ABR3NEJ5_9TELE